jgi:palmitoyltransferase ZDHHC13/17
MTTLDEAWTALHYGAFTGNLDAVYTLIENKADINALNASGLNMLHVAAQGDSAPPLYLFKMLGVDQNSVDNRGSTPLHWACYSQSETALQYLLAWSPDVNIRDKQGYTPLHLAVRSAEALDSCRPVRALMIKGADPTIKDERGKTAFDYA